MSWRAVVAALDDAANLRSKVSVYLHPLGGRPILWHVLQALSEVVPAPSEILVLHRKSTPVTLPEFDGFPVRLEPVDQNDSESRALRAGITSTGTKVLVDGAAPLILPATIARLLRGAEGGVSILARTKDEVASIAVAGEGPALASFEDPRSAIGAIRIAPTSDDELIRVFDRHSLSDASVALRDRLVRQHEAAGVSFLIPATVWIDAGVHIGEDTLVYPGVVIEGRTDIGSECVIGPHSRIVESAIGRGVELKGWNYVVRTSIRNHAVLEPHVRRGID
ncbi:MAG: hypothetical protein H7Z74_11685 [Anaerolineae bacterium]|nr:hypothetical protein [Gemmatimonadaceae bacterium]